MLTHTHQVRFTNVFVKNLPLSVDDAKLGEIFKKYGSITSAVVMKGADGTSDFLTPSLFSAHCLLFPFSFPFPTFPFFRPTTPFSSNDSCISICMYI
jgi:RNA recognition motif-containing protein